MRFNPLQNILIVISIILLDNFKILSVNYSKMQFKKIWLILLVMTLVSSFSKGCNKYDSGNMNRCTDCSTGYFLNNYKCYACPRDSKIEACQLTVNNENKDIKNKQSQKAVSLKIESNGSAIADPNDVVNSNNNQTIKNESRLLENKENKTDSTSNVQIGNTDQKQSDLANVTQIIPKQSTQIVQSNEQKTTSLSNNQDQRIKDNFFAIFGLFNCLTLSMQPHIHCIKCKDGFILDSQNKCQQIITPSPTIPIIVSQSQSFINKTNNSVIVSNTTQDKPTQTKLNTQKQNDILKNAFIPINLIHGKNQLNSPSNKQNKPLNNAQSGNGVIILSNKPLNQSNISNSALFFQSKANQSQLNISTTQIKEQPKRQIPKNINIPIVILPKTQEVKKQQEVTLPIQTINKQQTIQMPLLVQFKDINCAIKNTDFSFKLPVSIQNKRCSKCFTHYYYNLMKQLCMPVDPLCKTANQFNQCLTCYPGYNLFDNKCTLRLSQALNTQTAKSVNQQGRKNNLDPNCQKYMQNSFKCQICSFKYYYNQQKTLCTEVDPSCKSWDQSGYCKSCFQGYQPNTIQRKCSKIKILQATDPLDPHYQKIYCLNKVNNKCAKCAYKHYLRNGICLPVDDLCKAFHANFGYCTQCYQGYYLNNGECLNIVQAQVNTDPFCTELDQINPLNCISCIQGYFLNRQNKCQAVSGLCGSYEQRNGHCKSCILNYTLDESTGTCIYKNN